MTRRLAPVPGRRSVSHGCGGPVCRGCGGGRGARRGRFRFGRDRGSSAVELAILAPALLLATMLIIQFALWFNARHAALAAAQAGARIAREEAASNPSWQADAVTEATNYYDALGTKLLTNVQVPPPSMDNATHEVSVTVTGQLAGILPWHMTITQTVAGPIECFHPVTAGGGCGP